MLIPLPTPDGDSYPSLSGLNHLLFCERRCYLLRVEGVWVDNEHTIAGTLDHTRAHATRDAIEGAIRTARGLRIISHRLRIAGVADVVEFHQKTDGIEVPFPIEYKRGKKRRWDNDEAQLCGQALCLEEMLGVVVPAGAIFHVKSKRRREVVFDAALRGRTEAAVVRLHQLIGERVAPPPRLLPKCKPCSVRSVCMPELLSDPSRYERAARLLYCVPPS